LLRKIDRDRGPRLGGVPARSTLFCYRKSGVGNSRIALQCHVSMRRPPDYSSRRKGISP